MRRPRKSEKSKSAARAELDTVYFGGSVGELIQMVGEAYGLDVQIVVKQIALIARRPSGESDPSRETILSYIKPPGLLRRNRLTPCHHRFAHLVINYLDGRRPTGEESVDFIADAHAWKRARQVCIDVLRRERDRRFEPSPESDPGTSSIIGNLAGTYAVCRQDTTAGRYRQDLLILRNVGTRRLPKCHCFYISTHVVTRGEWGVVGNALWSTMTGLRTDNSHELINIYLGYATGQQQVMSGFLAGTSTEARTPLTVPLVAVKIPDAPDDMQHIGELGDEFILKAFTQLTTDLDLVEESLDAILRSQMSPILFQSSIINPILRRTFDDGKMLIKPDILEFVKTFGTEKE